MIRLLIADDHALVRRGIRQIVATTSDLAVTGEASRGAEVLEAVRTDHYDLVLLDLTMPGFSGIDLIRRVRAAKPQQPIVVVSMHNEGQVVSRALRAGANGYVAKDSEPEILLAAIRKVAAGGRYLDPALLEAIAFTAGSDAPPDEILSDREFEVLRQLAAGDSLNEIAERLKLSAKTVSTHKTRLMQKLGLDNNADLIRYAIRHGLGER